MPLLPAAKLPDSLAGRLEVIRLHPLAQVELRKQEACFLGQLFSANFKPVASERMGLALGHVCLRCRCGLCGRTGLDVGLPGPGEDVWNSCSSRALER